MTSDLQRLLLGCLCSKAFPSHCFFQGGRKDRDSQASTAQHSITPLEAHLPALSEQPMPHCTITPPLFPVCHTTLFSFLLLVHTRTCLDKPVARGHYPKGNSGSQTNPHLCFIFRAAVHVLFASQAVSHAANWLMHRWPVLIGP